MSVPAAIAAGEVASVWSEILGRPVGVDDDFFEIGGMSLDAVRIVTRIEDRVGILLSVRHVLEARTPREMARRVSETLEGFGDDNDTNRSELDQWA